MEFISLSKWADGEERELGTVKLLTEGGLYKACLNNLDEGSYAFLSAQTFTGLLEALEKALASQQVEWRASKPFEASKGKGRGQGKT